MTRFILALFFSLSFLNLSAQDTTSPVLSKADLLKRGKDQKIAAFVLLGGGIALLGLAADNYQINIDLSGSSSSTKGSNSVATVFAIAGVCSLIGSIACFAASNRNLKKGASLSISNQPLFLPMQKFGFTKAQTALTLKVPLH